MRRVRFPLAALREARMDEHGNRRNDDRTYGIQRVGHGMHRECMSDPERDQDRGHHTNEQELTVLTNGIALSWFRFS